MKRLAAVLLLFALGPGAAQARTGYCRPRTALPAGMYQKTCSCTVEHCDYLVCTCDGTTHSSMKITGCTSQSFSDVGGALHCD